ncbi:MAG: hypothetical protein M3680_07250 [Myxococcota bacterium]|nr:hypothetical protein [Myxococcota bacterium]
MINVRKLIPLLVLPFAACDSQVDGGHKGEVLARLEGTMHATEPRPSVQADVSVVWVIGSGGTAFVGADHVEVEGTLPSSFQLSVFTPPSDEQMFEWDGIRFGTAFVAATPPGEDPQTWQQWLGTDMDHVLVYLPESPPADSDVAALLRGTPSPGFHLYSVDRVTEAERQERLACRNQLDFAATLPEVFAACGGTANDDLIPLAADLDTLLSIEIVPQFGLDEFNRLPSWYGL